jgi:hypothetical protein
MQLFCTPTLSPELDSHFGNHIKMAEVAQNSPAESQAKQVVYCGGKSHGPQSNANIPARFVPYICKTESHNL